LQVRSWRLRPGCLAAGAVVRMQMGRVLTAFNIRRAKPADADAILRCLSVAFEPYREQYSVEGFRDTTLTSETIGHRMRDMVLLVACTASGDVVGTIAWQLVDREEGHIRGMAVLPEFQSRGVAQKLLGMVERELQDQGCSRVTLDTTAPLQRAIHFYEKNGYRRSGKVGDFFGMPLYEYVKDLLPTTGTPSTDNAAR